VYLLDIYAARETDTLGVSSGTLADAAQRLGAPVRYTADADTTVRAIARDARAGDLVVTMGAGDVSLLGPRILEALSS
jgi:UDP-N-acetylmuramate--alanine ligase